MSDKANESMNEEHVSGLSTMLKTLIVFVILGTAAMIAAFFILFPAQTEKKTDTQAKTIIVKTQAIALGDYPVEIEVMGQVIAAHEAALKAQVSGEIKNVEAEFIPGGFFQEGDNILQIDPLDYALDIKIKQSALRQARASLQLERGQQAIARDELKIIEQSTGKKLSNSDLALRKPQLEQAKANIDSAKAALELATLNLMRTEIKAPFNALVSARTTDLGNIVSSQDVLATLVNTDEYWIDVEIPVHNMRWLKTASHAGEIGSKAIIYLDGGRGTRSGSLLKSTGSLDKKTRLAAIIVSVPDPLLLHQVEPQRKMQKSPLVLGDYVRIILLGTTLHEAARIPQSYLRDGNTIWLERGGKLIIQPIVIAYEDRKYAYITRGIEKGDHIIISNIITPIHGMDITVHNDKDEQE